MSQISRLPLPSISLVLTTDHTRIPRRPSCIKVAPLPALPTLSDTNNARFDPMRTVHVRDFEPEPFLEERCMEEKGPQSRQHVVYFKDVESEDFKLAESIYEVPPDAERVGVGKIVKRKISSVFSTFRRLLCEDLPRVCFCQTCCRSCSEP